MDTDCSLKLGDMAIVIATLAGPVLAVQAQKLVERRQETFRRRVAIFRTLMASRGNLLSQEHVQALNVVPIEFYGQRGKLKGIVDSWKTYIDHHTPRGQADAVWSSQRNEFLKDLLRSIGNFLGYDFTKVELGNEVYMPFAHSQAQVEQDEIRRGLARLVKGEIALPMEVRSLPSDPAFVENQIALQGLLRKWLDGQQAVRVFFEEGKK